MRTSSRVSFLVFWLLTFVLGCGGGKDQPAPDVGQPVDMGVADVSDDVAAPLQTPARFAGTCGEASRSGEVVATAEVTDAYGVAAYEYEVFPAHHWLRVGARNSAGEPVGTLVMNQVPDRRDLPQPSVVSFKWFPDADLQDVSDTSGPGQAIEMAMRFRPLEVGRTEQTTTISRGDESLQVVAIFAEDIEDVVLSVQRPPGATPALGSTFATLGGDVRHTLDIRDEGEWLDEQSISDWFDQVEVPAWLEGDDIQKMYAVVGDRSWLIESLDHVLGCNGLAGLSELQATARLAALGPNESCDVGDVLWTGGGIFAVVSVLVAVPAVIAGLATGATVAAGVAGGLALASAALAVAGTLWFIYQKWCTADGCAAACKQYTEGGACTGTFECTCSGEFIAQCIADPHLVSLDGLFFDVQGAGEFVLAEATAGAPFVVQVRMEPVESSRCPYASVNTAVATEVAGTRVEFYDRTGVVKIDGHDVELHTETLELPGGGELSRDASSGGWSLLYPGGERLLVAQRGALDVAIDVPGFRRGQIHGLLGKFDGSLETEFGTRDGRMFPEPLGFLEFYEEFVDSWRVADEESLFSYADGESTATFLVPGFPQQPQTVPADEADAARQVCTDAGVTDPVLLEACTLDVYCAGEDFALSYEGVSFERAAEIDTTVEPLLDGWTEQGSSSGILTTLTVPNSARSAEYEGPMFYVSPDDRRDFHATVFITPDADDDDVVGVVFGYNAPIEAAGNNPLDHDMFVFGWKQSAEDHAVWGSAEEGMYLAHVHGLAPDLDAASTMFWNPANGDPAQVDVIATNAGPNTGYEDLRAHRVDLFYTSTGIRIDVDGLTVFDVPALSLPRPPTAGRLGFMTLSQGARFHLRTAQAAPGFCDRSDFEVVPCEAIDTDRVLDGQVMICPDGPSVSANLTMVNGSAILTGGRIRLDAGSIQATGTEDCPILFGSSDEQLQQGDLRYVFIASSEPSSFEHVVFENGGDNGLGTNFILGTSANSIVSLRDVTFRHTVASALDIEGTATTLENLSFSHVPELPMLIRPRHVELLNGVRFSPTSIGQPYVDIVGNENITEDYTWSDPGAPMRFSGDLTIQSALEIAPGTTLYIEPGRRFFVSGGGRFLTRGTASEPVRLLSSGGAAGDWSQFTFTSDAGTSELHHTTVSHGGGGGVGALNTRVGLILDNVTFVDNLGCDVSESSAGLVTATNTTYVSCN